MFVIGGRGEAVLPILSFRLNRMTQKFQLRGCKNCNERGESGKLEIGKRETERKNRHKMRQTKEYAHRTIQKTMQ